MRTGLYEQIMPHLTFAAMNNVLFRDLGRKPYKETWDYQESLLKAKVAAKSLAVGTSGDVVAEEQPADMLLFVEHPPVYTLGTNGKQTNVLLNAEQLAKRGIEYYHINRGGDITFHGPGQIVGYPIIDLEHFKRDLGWYLRSLEEMIILTMAEYGLKGERSAGETGVWLDTALKGRERKICAMGIRCSRWVTMHGFALNVNTNLDYFNFIIPCGIQNKQVTSLAKELGRQLPIDEVKANLKRNFEKVFGVQLI